MNDIENKVKIIKNSNLFTYEAKAARIVDQQAILLTLTDQKPVSMLNTNKWIIGGKNKISAPEDHEAIQNFLSSLDLKYSITDIGPITKVVMSLDQNLVDKFNQNIDSDKITGELLGYPSTSVDAYGNDDLMLSLEEQDKICKEAGLPEYMPNFRLSKLHYEDELKTLISWHETLAKYYFLN